MTRKNYGASHTTFKVSAKRFDLSPFMSKYANNETVFGISANRFYPLSTEDDPSDCYWNLRNNVMLYDVPEKPIEISGPHSIKLLEKVFTRTVTDLKINRARYAIACTHEGGVLMDGVLIRLKKEKFWYVHANGDFETWLLAHSKGYNVNIRDPKSWVIQIQGPNALKVLKSAVPTIELSKFKYFHAQYLNFDGQKFLVSRTGWTGEIGFEVYTNGPNDNHTALWEFLIEMGKDYGIMAGGLDSMGIRRIEAGILDYGTDMNRTNNPFEVGLGSFVDLNKAQFIGKDRLSTMSRKTKLFGIKTSTAIPFAGLEIIENNKVVGYTTVGAFSPFLNAGIGYVLFHHEAAWLGKKLWLREADKSLHSCTVMPLPFFDASKKIPRGISDSNGLDPQI